MIYSPIGYNVSAPRRLVCVSVWLSSVRLVVRSFLYFSVCPSVRPFVFISVYHSACLTDWLTARNKRARAEAALTTKRALLYSRLADVTRLPLNSILDSTG